MSSFQIVTTPEAAKPVAAYSQAVKVNGMVYTSGQIALDPSGKAIEGSVADKTHACIKSLEAILKASGSSISQVVKTTVFITSSDDFGTVNDVYAQYFTHKPARSCVVVKALPMGFPVEIEAVAVAA